MGGGRLRGFMAKLRRDIRALSPIFAVLLLIAIAVIAGIIIYMYTSGYLSAMMGGGSAGQEKVAVEALELKKTLTGWTATVYAVNSAGGPTVYITGVIVRDSSGNTVYQESIAAPGTQLLPGVLTPIGPTGDIATLNAGDPYTVALVSAAGNQFVSGSVKAPAV